MRGAFRQTNTSIFIQIALFDLVNDNRGSANSIRLLECGEVLRENISQPDDIDNFAIGIGPISAEWGFVACETRRNGHRLSSAAGRTIPHNLNGKRISLSVDCANTTGIFDAERDIILQVSEILSDGNTNSLFEFDGRMRISAKALSRSVSVSGRFNSIGDRSEKIRLASQIIH